MKNILRSVARRSARLGISCLIVGAGGMTFAATTDLATAPLFTSSATQVKPNILFVLDDSGSMAWDFLPDVSNFSSTKYGKGTSQCNGVAYNPNVLYTPPLNADGTQQADASLSFITPDPTTQTTTPRNVAGPVTMPLTASGTMTIRVTDTDTAKKMRNWYGTDATVTVWTDSTHFFTANVVSWDPSTGNVVLDLSNSVITTPVAVYAMTSPKVSYGAPKSVTYYKYKGTQKPLSYQYTSAGVITNTPFYQECNATVGSLPNTFQAVTINSSSPEAQSYANWLKYYSTRILMMKTSISRAFKTVDDRYRIGFTNIHNTDATPSTDFLDVKVFDATQKAAFYSAVNAANPVNATPLRGSLSLAGRYYAKKAPNQASDPMEYSCQRNFTILSTDGYWNTGNESPTTIDDTKATAGNASTNFGPFGLDNFTLVGQQDGGATLRPMFDGGNVTATTTETWTTTTVTTRTDTTSQTKTDITTTSTTAATPKTGAQQRNNQVLLTAFNVTPGTGGTTMSVSSGTVTVTMPTGSTHNLATGDVIKVSGGSNATFTGNSVTVTRVSDTVFTYAAPASGSPGTTAYTFTPPGAACIFFCGGYQRTWLQTSNTDLQTTLTQTTTVTPSTSTVTVTTTTTTPYTRTTTVTNGVTISDTTSAGAPTSTSSSSTPVVSNGTATSSTTSKVISTITGAAGVFANTSLVSTGTTFSFSASGAGSATALSGATSYTNNLGTASTSTPPVTSSAPGTTTTTESAHTTSTNTTASGGSVNSLADVAMYYYNTDLRTTALSNCTGALGTDVCQNNVPGNTASAQKSFGDAATWQHMTTFTLGLGVSGLLNYDPNYQTQTTGDFVSILNRTKDWPVPGVNKGPENVDDLWHAAVNGRGQYFSAGDPTSLATSLSGAIDAIRAVTGAAAAASTSSLQPVEGDNDVFVAEFTSVKWIGDVLSYRIDPSSGQISSKPVWSARTQLDALAPASRTIYYPKPSGGSALQTFTYNNLKGDSYAQYFDNFCTLPGAGGAAAPSQCASLIPADTTSANTGSNLVSYLRGDQTLTYYRQRDALLGDIISASPLFVGKPQFKYTENNYATFASSKANRQAVVLAAANDGMLHAFDRGTGNELWAFVPSFVIPNLYKLADNAYTNNHRFYVDGSPQMGDIYVGGAWKTIVVGGLNGGGRGYYALDVTDPSAPQFLWEFKDTDLGLTYGNPIITKRADGTWIVAFTSGYNNVNNGDGNGHLYILDANTGKQLDKIDTTLPDGTAAGNSTTPSGLGKLNVWVDDVSNNLAKRFYAGDLLGNLWRFDIDNLVQPNNAAVQLAKLTAPDGTAQSITTKPTLAEVRYNGGVYPVVYVATGRYLGSTDLASSQVQSVYAIKDPLANTPLGTARTSNKLVTQTLSTTTNASGTAGRSISTQPVDWLNKSGWFTDFPVGGERVSVNPQLTLDTLTVGTILPSGTACTVGGESFLYRFNITTGGSTLGAAVNGSAAIGTYVGNVLIQGLTTVQLKAGTQSSSIVTITTRSDATLQTDVTAAPTSSASLRRTSWRELVD
ncbi:PilC/PilY family type IV pilus protein [Ramlibacter sp. MMS24-I3-19]|uniref:PilC/PilY family type IV pilus protein n=1 Tax=Ramlibacter sp. MMS24-I3-19 TaxID=3416606 RepID=UPI003D0152E6